MYKEQYLAPFLFKRFVCFRRFTQYSCIDSSAGGANLAESQNNCWGGRSQWQWWEPAPWSAAWWWTWQPRWSEKWKLSPCPDFQWIQNLTRLVQISDDAKMTPAPQPPVSEIKTYFCEIKNIFEVRSLIPLHILVLITIPHSIQERAKSAGAK